MPWGVTAAGFIRKTLADIQTDAQERLRKAVGRAVKVIAQSGFGTVLNVLLGEVDDLWQLLEELAAQFDPEKATGAFLDALAALTGTYRKAATYSTGTLYLTGDTGTVVPSSSRAQNPAGDLSAISTAGGTLAAAAPWAASTAYVAGDVRRASGNIYYAVTAGTSGTVAPSSEPTNRTDLVQDNGVQWLFVGEGDAYAAVAGRADDIGAVAINAMQLVAIGTPVAGWRGVANVADFVTGNDAETDDQLRLRRLVELKGLGKATLASIEAAVSALPDVTAVNVFENHTDFTDADGLPPHSIEVLVSGSESAATIRSTIFAAKAAGIETYGTISGTVTDTKGRDHTVRHSVPAALAVYVEATLYVDDDIWPHPSSVGEDAALVSLLAHGDILADRVAYDARPGAFVARLFQDLDPDWGLLDAAVKVATVPITGSTPVAAVPVSVRQFADVDASRTTVVVVRQAP